jgi:hypothetical protein
MFRLIFRLHIAGLNMDPCFTTDDSVVQSQYTQVMYKVCIKSIGKSHGKIDLFQILLQCHKILRNKSLVHRYTFANGVATTQRLPGRRIPKGP